MQYVQQQMKRIVMSSQKAKRDHTAALQQSISQMRTAAEAVTTFQARVSVHR